MQSRCQGTIHRAHVGRGFKGGDGLPRVVNSRYGYLLPASAFANASLQSSLMSAVWDFMQSAIAPLPGLTSAQNCLTSALQALPTAAARMIAT
jgi:hypothetical protein